MSSESTGFSGKPARSRKSKRCVHYQLGVPAAKFNLVVGKDGRQLDEIKEKSGANVHPDKVSRPTDSIRVLSIDGTWTQIRSAIYLILEEAGVKDIVKKEAQEFWRQWIAQAYPELQSRAYFLPPVFMNRVPMTRKMLSGQELTVLHPSSKLHPACHPSVTSLPKETANTDTAGIPSKDTTDRNTAGVLPQPTHVQDSDIAKDAALEQVISRLKKMAVEHKEIFMAVSQLPFGNYLGDPAHLYASVLFPITARLPAEQRQGSLDLLLIHRIYGFVVCEVKATGSSASHQEIGKKMKKAATQLDKAQGVLTHLVSDIAPGIRVTKAIALPHLWSSQVQRTLEADHDLTQCLCQCLGASGIDDIIARCICYYKVHFSGEVDEKLRRWWELHVTFQGSDPLMTKETYENIVARFCGPATTVTVPSISSSRLALRTLGHAVSQTGVCYEQITLFPEEVDLICRKPYRVFLAGPPGTGKTVVLMLMALEWLLCGHDVYVVGTSQHSRIVCSMLYYLLQHALDGMSEPGKSQGRPHLLQYSFSDESEIDRATQELTDAAENDEIYVIADEVGPDDAGPAQDYPHLLKQPFQTFCEGLLARIPNLRLWAASCKHGVAPSGWKVEYFTRPLRCPPSVVREVETAQEIGEMVTSYTSREVPDHTQGPPVKFIQHEGSGHCGLQPVDCKQCGMDVAVFLKSLGVGGQENWVKDKPSMTSGVACRTEPDVCYPPDLRFKDVLVLCIGQVGDNSGVVEGLRGAGMAVKVLTESQSDIQDIAEARSDVVWVSYGNVVRGIERKVVVCVRNEYQDTDEYNRLYPLSRCTSQLVLVVPARPSPVDLG